MNYEDKIEPSDLAGIYKNLAEVLGIESTIKLHKYFQGQQINLPKKLFTKAYILEQLGSTANNANIKSIAIEYGYTERRLRQIIKENHKNSGGS